MNYHLRIEIKTPRDLAARIAAMPAMSTIIHNNKPVFLAIFECEFGQIKPHLEISALVTCDKLLLHVEVVVLAEDLL
jgi:hypothetical protein